MHISGKSLVKICKLEFADSEKPTAVVNDTITHAMKEVKKTSESKYVHSFGFQTHSNWRI